MELYKTILEHKPLKYSKIIKREISNFGNIRDTYKNKLRYNNGIRIHQGYNKNGWRAIEISDIEYRIHTLVYKYHIGKLPNDYGLHKMVIDHKDDVRDNNHYSNLQLLTSEENKAKRKLNKMKKGCCFTMKKGNKKYGFKYYINLEPYYQYFYKKVEQLELQLLYIELIQDGLIK